MGEATAGAKPALPATEVLLQENVEGEVQRYNDMRGFGFIRPDAHYDLEGDVFFHIKQVEKGYPPARGDRVRFDLLVGNPGYKAANVCFLDPHAPSEGFPADAPGVETASQAEFRTHTMMGGGG